MTLIQNIRTAGSNCFKTSKNCWFSWAVILIFQKKKLRRTMIEDFFFKKIWCEKAHKNDENLKLK